MSSKKRAPRNRTLTLSTQEMHRYRRKLMRLSRPVTADEVLNKTIHQNMQEAIPHLPSAFVDLLFIDPPYNLDKRFNQKSFQSKKPDVYADWVKEWLTPLIRLLKPTASIYICCDWKTSVIIHAIAQQHFIIRNRITWEREKGRGATTNWKNGMEDIWYCTMSNQYCFNVDAVKLKRFVLAPYTHRNGDPKDWYKTKQGNYRLTHPSNLWTDITIPFWSMPENTDHPTQKPEKLLAKIILASTHPNDVVFDPFAGSGTTSVVAQKLGRRYVSIEQDEMYCCLAEKRLVLAKKQKDIQGYQDGCFWERNTFAHRKNGKATKK